MKQKQINKLLKDIEKIEAKSFKRYHKRHKETAKRIRALLLWFFLELCGGEKITYNSCFKPLTNRDRSRLTVKEKRLTGKCRTRRDLLHYLLWEILLNEIDFAYISYAKTHADTVSLICSSFHNTHGNKGEGKDLSLIPKGEKSRIMELITKGKQRVFDRLTQDIDRSIIREDDLPVILDLIEDDYVKRSDYTTRQQEYTENTFGISETLRELSGAESYIYVTAHDKKVCGDCRALEGMEFKYVDAVKGVNYPPIHPWCRCIAVPVLEGENDTNSNYGQRR